ncbi:MAG: ATP-binding cassette domain-containing protein [Myxococcota bacterium]
MPPQEPCYQLSDVSFRFPGRSQPSLHELSFTIAPGERVLITGATGSGKSTLLRLLAGLIPHFSEGSLTGELRLHEQSLPETPRTQLQKPPGMVLQSPDAQLCTSRVSDEVRFGLQNLNLPHEELARRTHEALQHVGLWNLRDAETSTLSGGQKQRLVIAATLAMRPAVLLLDEPISQLDPQGAHEVLSVLEEVCKSQTLTLIMVEHRLELVAPLFERVLILDKGKLAFDGSAQALWQDPSPLRTRGLEVPFLPELFEALERPERPLRWREALPFFYELTLRQQAERYLATRLDPSAHAEMSHPSPAVPRAPILSAQHLHFSWPAPVGQGPAQKVLHDISLELRPGERIALLGANGSGKSSLLACLAGLQTPELGQLDAPPLAARGLLVQEPDLMLLEPRVHDELRYSLRLQGLAPREIQQRVEVGLQQLQLEKLAEEPPQSLSRGQRLRVVLAALLTRHPRLLLLDEPTAGQDRGQIARMMQQLRQQPQLETLVFVTHDLELALRHATRLLVLERGRLVLDIPREDVLNRLDELCLPGLRWPSALLLLHALRQGPPVITSVSVESGEVKPVSVESAGEKLAPFMLSPSQPTTSASELGVQEHSLSPHPPRGWLETLDPRLKLSVVLCAGLWTVALEHPPGLLLLVSVGGMAVVLAGLRPGALRSLGLTLLAACWGTTLGQGLFYALEPRTVWITLLPEGKFGGLDFPGVLLYLEGVRYGLVQSLRFSALILLGAALCASTSPERLFQALRWLRVPYGLSFMAVTAVRFLPLSLQELQLVRAVQRLRGYVPFQRGLRQTLTAELGALRPLLMRTLRRATELATALTLRHFDALDEQHHRLQPLRGATRASLVFLIAMTVCIVCMKILFVMYREEIFFLPSLRPLYGWIRTVL